MDNRQPLRFYSRTLREYKDSRDLVMRIRWQKSNFTSFTLSTGDGNDERNRPDGIFSSSRALASAAWCLLRGCPGWRWAAGQDDFYFVQLSDTHWGFEGPPNPDAKGTLKKAVADGQQPRAPAGFHHVYRRPHAYHRQSRERRKRMSEFREIVSELKVKDRAFHAGRTRRLARQRQGVSGVLRQRRTTRSITRACISSWSTTYRIRAR